MATLTARAIGLDMGMLVESAAWAPTYFAEALQQTSTVFELRIINSGAMFYVLRLTGSNFTYSSGVFPTGGTVTGASYRYAHVDQFDLAGVSIPAADIAADFQQVGLDWVLSGLFDAANRFNGSSGDDELYGTNGNDVIDGRAGGDRMAGGAGDDQYVVNKWVL